MMKLARAFILMAVILALFMAQGTEQSGLSTRGPSRFLSHDSAPRDISCRRNPYICRARGSMGNTCCNNKCVDVKTDKHNCGACRFKCKYTQACCKGKCVYLAFDKRNCGRCSNRCKKGEYCLYGLCNYV